MPRFILIICAVMTAMACVSFTIAIILAINLATKG